MTFVNPSFLWALLAVALPILIHLFNYRKYKKVYFTNVRFLKELQLESKSRSRLKEILVLIARCLTIAALVLAFCQPMIFDKQQPGLKKGPKAISIYLDNSFSMQNVSKQGPLIEVAKTLAKEIVSAYGGADKFQILSNDFEGKHQRFYSKEEALQLIDEIKVSSALRALDRVLSRQRDFLKGSECDFKKSYVLSDAQKSTFTLEKCDKDTSVDVVLIPLVANPVNNVYVDTCWFESPLQQKGFIQKLHAVIVNNGESGVDAGSARLYLNKKQIALASFSLDAKSKQEVQFTFECKTEGFNYASVKMDDYPITFDDELFFAFNSALNISVYLINGKGEKSAKAFESLFKNDSIYSFHEATEQNVNYSEFKNSDVIILNQLSEISSGMLSELKRFSEQGGALLIIPPAELNVNSYTAAFSAMSLPEWGEKDTVQQRTQTPDPSSGFYAGVFEKLEERLNLPLARYHYRLQKHSQQDFETILALQNNDELLGRGRYNNLSVYLFSTPFDPEAGNFSKHALFVPTVYQMCFQSVRPVPLYFPVSSNQMIVMKNDASLQEQPPHLKEREGETDIIPESRNLNNGLSLFTQNQIIKPGFYDLQRGNNVLMPLAFNYGRRESDLSCYSSEELLKIIDEKHLTHVKVMEELGGNFSERILLESEGRGLWKLFIILALGCIAAELTLLRILK